MWRGEVSLRGQHEEVKVDVLAYALVGGRSQWPTWPRTLVCDARGLESAHNASILASRIRNPGFARLQAVLPNGEEVVDPRLKSVAEVIEQRGAAFDRSLEGYMVVASRDEAGEIGLYVLYEMP